MTSDVLNVLDRHDHDFDYYYQSGNSPLEGAGRYPAHDLALEQGIDQQDR